MFYVSEMNLYFILLSKLTVASKEKNIFNLKMSHSVYHSGFCMKTENKRLRPLSTETGPWAMTVSSSRALVHTVNCLLLPVVLAVSPCYYPCHSLCHDPRDHIGPFLT